MPYQMGKAFRNLYRKLFSTKELGRGIVSGIEGTSHVIPERGVDVGFPGLFYAYCCDLVYRKGAIAEKILVDEDLRPHIGDVIVELKRTFLGIPFTRYRKLGTHLEGD